MSGVEIRALRKSFRTHEVLKGIDLDLAPGEVVGLIGPNGAGKTTLMSCLLGFLTPNEGTIAFDGRANDDLDIRRRTGFVPERMNFGRRATGYDFLHYMARLAGVPRANVEKRVRELLARLELTAAADRRLSQYSRGMLQRIGMAQALIHEPAYVFLDEPTSGLDPNGVLLVRDLIAEQKARGAAVLLNSHQLSEVEKVCDRVLFLKNGFITRDETLRHADRIVVAITLLAGSYDANAVARITGAAPQNDVAIVSVDSMAGIAARVRELVESGAGVVDVRRHTADLERIFRGEA
ncbi:MAG: ABC transporter ATP-binding protein [Acidobacteria bacterium]|nr:ABC transporter ATP-binding protein [Acidobacteriota bacterium]MBV9475463.1 ABC transporter ATP-binding protein [Acidobacteriota bacterium]